MSNISSKTQAHLLRKKRVRAKVSGVSERPRLTVTISNLHVSAQLIDDQASKTLASATTVGQKAKSSLTEKAALIGKEIGSKAKKAKITKVTLDRNGRQYAARLKALTDALRQEGIEV